MGNLHVIVFVNLSVYFSHCHLVLSLEEGTASIMDGYFVESASLNASNWTILPATDVTSMMRSAQSAMTLSPSAEAALRIIKHIGKVMHSQWPPSLHLLTGNRIPDGYLNKTKWIVPTRSEYLLYDGEPTRRSGMVPLFETFPTMVKGDLRCITRTQNNSICRNPVTNARGKLALGLHVRYDPSKNKRNWPGPPLKLWGNSQTGDKPGNQRRKRAYGAIALAFGGLSTVAGFSHTERAMKNLRQELNAEIDKTVDQMNSRFAKNEGRLQHLGTVLNQQTAISTIQDQRLNKIVRDILAGRAILEERLEVMEHRIDANSKAILYQFSDFINLAETARSMSMAELEIHRLVLDTLRNLTGVKCFDRSKAYEVRISSGLVRLREIAQLSLS